MRIANNEKRDGMRHAFRTTLCSVGSNDRNQSLKETWMRTEKLCIHFRGIYKSKTRLKLNPK